MKKLTTTKKTKNRVELLLATLIALFFVIYSFMFLIEATNATVPLLVKLIEVFFAVIGFFISWVSVLFVVDRLKSLKNLRRSNEPSKS
jgi:hypothetical protein